MQLTLKDKSFAISCHEIFDVGPAQDLRDFLLDKKTRNLLYIAHPLLTEKETYENRSKFSIYKKGKIIKRHEAFHWALPEPLLYIKDFIYTLLWVYSQRYSFDLFTGVDPLNALAGLILRKFGKVKKVIYYSIDYFPRRFTNPLMNRIYYLIDSFCVRYADETWNVSPNMAITREKNYHDKSLRGKQMTVPIGVGFKKVRRRNFSKINTNKLVYIGLLSKAMGVELIIKALPKIIKKIPQIRLEVLGGGPEENNLRKISKEMGLEGYVKFYGWVKDKDLKFKLMADAAAGLFLCDKKLYKQEIQNADPMKIKDYMVLGMPVISTDIISTAGAIVNAGAGVIIKYDENQLANAVINLLSNKNKLKDYRENALAYIKHFDFEIVYGKNLQRLLSEIR